MGVRRKHRILSLKPLTLHRMKSARKIFSVTQQEGSERNFNFKYRFQNFVMPVSQCRRPNERRNVHFEGPTAERQMERERERERDRQTGRTSYSDKTERSWAHGSVLPVCAATQQSLLVRAFEKRMHQLMRVNFDYEKRKRNTTEFFYPKYQQI